MSKKATARSAISAERAMKLALDYIVATNKSSEFWLVPESNLNKTVIALREELASEAIEQPAPATELREQEPVAWRVKVETKLRDGSVDVGYQLRNEKMSKHDEPLYTSPPAQRTWVHATEWRGLTDDEIYSVLENLQVMHHRPPTTDSRVIFALAVEAKLKEKNT